MTKIFVPRVRKITNLILVSSIISLTLISILPCFAEDITGEILYYNIDAIKNNNNILFDSLNMIVICNWMLILFSILSLIGLMLIVSNKYSNVAKIIMLIICVNIIFSALSVLLSWVLIKNTGDINGARAPLILNGVLINYQYFPFISSAISLAGSILYLIIVPNFYFKYFMGLKKQKKFAEKQSMGKITQIQSSGEGKVVVKKPSSKKIAPIAKQPFESTGEDSFEGYIQEDHADSEQYPAPELRLKTKKESLPEKEEPVDVKGPYERTFEQEPESDISKQDYSEKKEQQTSSLFEQALSSAIEKRQFGTNKAEEPLKQSPLKKKLTIRCPECKNIFTAEKEEGVFETKIECPKCGRKGVIKQ